MRQYFDFWRRYFDFEGESNIAEFWIPTLVHTILLNVLRYGFNQSAEITTTLSILGLLMFIPELAILVRRMHDIGKSGWYWLWIFIPILGWILLLVACLQPSKFQF